MMDTVFKIGLLALFVVMMPHRAAFASSAEERDGAAFPQAETALLDELDNERGREGVDVTTLNNMNVRATLNGNEATNNITGFNIIDQGAFTDASGINSVIQNTGNNVVIQDSTIVNVTIMP